MSFSTTPGSVKSFSGGPEDENTSLIEVFKAVTKKNITGEQLKEALNFLEKKKASRGDKHALNETRTVEKIKYHLILGGRGKEAKEFAELHHKLKNMTMLKRRDALIELLYSLYPRDSPSSATSTKSTGSTSTASTSSTAKEPPTRANVTLRHSQRTVEPVPILKLREESNRIQQKQIPMLDGPLRVNFNKPLHPSVTPHSPGGLYHPPPPSNSHPIQPQPLDYHSNIRKMEKELIKDLIFIFQGIDGSIIKSTSDGGYEIITKEWVHPSLRLQTLRLCELGFFFGKIRSFIDLPSAGLMVHGFKHALESELLEYYRLLAIVQPQVQRVLVETPMNDFPRVPGDDMTLQKLCVWMYDVKPRLCVLSCMIDACQGKKGGEICSILYGYSLHGDPSICTMTRSLLSIVAKPLFLSICQWILYGDLQDPHNEFFIKEDPQCRPDSLWNCKFHIRKEMLPSFIGMRQAEKLLSTGKNINFLKEVCRNTKGFTGRGEVKAILESSPVECLFLGENPALNSAIDRAYQTTSAMVLKVLIEESRLLHHLRAIKCYLLLGQGDFIHYLLELIQGELSKPASKLFGHNISGILESAIRATNAQYDDEEVLARLDSRVTTSSDNDLGWDVFCLDYKVQGPIGTVLTEDVMVNYNQLFNTLWRAKRIEGILSRLWKNQTTLIKIQRILPEIAPVLHRSQFLISEMIHFVRQMQYYIMIEATEVGWNDLIQELNKAKDLDEVIQAHTRFMRTIMSRALLGDDCKELLFQIRGIFNNVLELESFLSGFDGRVIGELKKRDKIPKGNSKVLGEAQKKFFTEVVAGSKGKIELLYTTTQDLIQAFLFALGKKPDLKLQSLCFRLDFNEYYQHKDSRLGLPLTHQHRRLSLAPFVTSHASMSLSLSQLPSIQEVSFTAPPVDL